MCVFAVFAGGLVCALPHRAEGGWPYKNGSQLVVLQHSRGAAFLVPCSLSSPGSGLYEPIICLGYRGLSVALQLHEW